MGNLAVPLSLGADWYNRLWRLDILRQVAGVDVRAIPEHT